MATLPQNDIELDEDRLSPDEAAAALYKIVESHFDDLGLSEADRDTRYDKLRQRLDATDAVNANA